jgi:predicted RNase H-like nuclease (RuvC/YqgF family)
MAQEQEIEQEGVGIKTEEVEVEVPEDLEDQSIEVEEVESDNFTKAESATQKRIDKLTKKMRTAEREREAALKYAQQVQQESNDLKSRLGNLDQNYINEFSNRVETQMTTAEQSKLAGRIQKQKTGQNVMSGLGLMKP